MPAMYNNLHDYLIKFAGFVFALQAISAFASGREGEAYVEAVRWIVIIVLVVFVTLVLGGGLLDAFKSNQSGESILKGSTRGLLKGVVAFLAVAIVSVVGLTILSMLWVAYSFLYVYVLHPS